MSGAWRGSHDPATVRRLPSKLMRVPGSDWVGARGGVTRPRHDRLRHAPGAAGDGARFRLPAGNALAVPRAAPERVRAATTYAHRRGTPSPSPQWPNAGAVGE